MNERSLMQQLLDAGYPREDCFHHGSNLYVYITPLTRQIVHQYYREMGGDGGGFLLDTFRDQITGRPMYDCAFAYDPYWTGEDRW